MDEVTTNTILKHLEKAKYKSTHAKLSIPIINRIRKKMEYGIKFEPIRVNGDLIIDGHHRYVSSILASFNELKVVSYPKTSATKEFKWSSVTFLDEEWDTKEKIKRLNEIDASYNNLTLKEVIALTD
jgi:uncharacterized protein (DUF433 family)